MNNQKLDKLFEKLEKEQSLSEFGILAIGFLGIVGLAVLLCI